MTALEWLDRELAASGRQRSSEIASERVRPWAAVFEVPTSAGTLWFKACGPGTAFEVPLYGLLSRVAPDRALTPIAAILNGAGSCCPTEGRPRRTPSGAPSGRRPSPRPSPSMGACSFGSSRTWTRCSSSGSPTCARRRCRQRSTGARALAGRRRPTTAPRGARRRAGGRARNRVGEWCARLAESPLPASLDHNDLHSWNVLGEGADARARRLGRQRDAYPFAPALVPLAVGPTRLRRVPPPRRFRGAGRLPGGVRRPGRAPSWPRRSRSPAGWRRSPGCSPGSARSGRTRAGRGSRSAVVGRDSRGGPVDHRGVLAGPGLSAPGPRGPTPAGRTGGGSRARCRRDRRSTPGGSRRSRSSRRGTRPRDSSSSLAASKSSTRSSIGWLWAPNSSPKASDCITAIVRLPVSNSPAGMSPQRFDSLKPEHAAVELLGGVEVGRRHGDEVGAGDQGACSSGSLQGSSWFRT